MEDTPMPPMPPILPLEERKHRRYPRGPQLTIHVTAPTIEHAKVRDSSHCMIAMSVRDARPEATSVAVDLQTIRFSDPARRCRYTYLTPRIAQVALVQFDQGILPEPFSFQLRGSHVTGMIVKKKVQTPRSTLNEAQKKALKKAKEVQYGKKKVPDKQTLVEGNCPTNVPRRIGGTPPPLSSFARRREFGLRALKI